MSISASRHTDDELHAYAESAGITSDGEFEYGREVVRRADVEEVDGVFWLWVSDDECGISVNNPNYGDVREAAYAEKAGCNGSPLGCVEGTVSLGDDPGSYVKVLVDMNEIIEISEMDDE